MAKLRDAYVNLLLERGADREALAVRREEFDKHPTQTHYGALRRPDPGVELGNGTADWGGQGVVPELHRRADRAWVDVAAPATLNEDRSFRFALEPVNQGRRVGVEGCGDAGVRR